MLRRLSFVAPCFALACAHPTPAEPLQARTVPSSPSQQDGPWLPQTQVAESPTSGMALSELQGERFRVDVDVVRQPFVGSEDALVTLVVFHDYEDPYSRKLDDSLRALVEEFDGDFRVVYRQFPLPFHSHAIGAARAALAAHAQGRFADFHRAMFGDPRNLEPAQLEQTASRLGLERAGFAVTVAGQRVSDVLAEDRALAGQLGVRATPSFFINGRRHTGALPKDELRELIGEERETAAKLVEGGIPRPRLYAEIMAVAQASVAEPSKPSKPSSADDKRRPIDVAGLPHKGTLGAPVTIVECGDFDCPFCKRASATIDDLLAAHPGRVAFFWMHNPLPMHKDAMPAHLASIAAQKQGKFWSMHDLLFAQNRKRSDAELRAMAKKAGLDVKRFDRDRADSTVAARVKREIELCQSLDARGTPTFFVNGRKLSGAQPLDRFEAALAEELGTSP